MSQAKMESNAIEILKVTKYRNKYIVETTPYQDIQTKETFSETQIVENRIFKGKIFSIEEWQEVLRSKLTNDLFDKVLYYISFGLKTKQDIVLYLEKHDASQDDSEIIIKKLENLNLINDENYAINFLNKAINNHKGPIYVKNELKNKGIDITIIEKSLANYSYQEISENIDYIIKKELPSINTYPILKQKQKLYQKLQRMGYSNSQINDRISDIEFTSNYEERLKKEIRKLLDANVEKVKIKQKLIMRGYTLKEIVGVLEKIDN